MVYYEDIKHSKKETKMLKISKNAIKFGVQLAAVLAITTVVGTVLNNCMPEDDKTAKVVYQIGSAVIMYAVVTKTCDAIGNAFES